MKIRKITIVLCLLILLSGCSVFSKKSSKEEIYQKMDSAISAALNEETTYYQNLTKKYYSYYLSDNIGRRNATEASEELVCNFRPVLMSLNASAVVSSKYYADSVVYEDTVVDQNAVFSKSYMGNAFDGSLAHFLVNIYQMDNQSYLLVRSRYFVYLTQASITEMPSLVQEIIRIARTTTINSNEIIAAYSSKEIINYNQEVNSIFSQNIPENGRLEEMLETYFREYDFDDYDPEEFNEDFELQY